MQTKYSFTAMAVILLVLVAMMSIGVSMHAYAQNFTQPADTTAGQTTNMTNTTGLASSTGEDDDVGEGEEEGPEEDEDEPGDIDTNDKED
jgi:hypothetical protein